MTDITVVEEVMTGVPGLEVIKMTFSSGYTYQSRLKKPIVAIANSESRTGCYTAISGQTITITCASASGDTGYLIVFGLD